MSFRSFLLTATLLFASLLTASTQPLSEELFKNPPGETRPRTWMHAMSGNMSRAGLTQDLEAIARVGIGGVLLFTVTHRIPNGPVKFNSPEHLNLLKHAAAECERLQLSFGVHNCDGWTSSGGPWNTPANSMKMVVNRDVVVDGGTVTIQFPAPTAREDFYRDIAVVAYPALCTEVEDAENIPTVTSNDPAFDVSLATDGRLDRYSVLHSTKAKRAYVQFAYNKPFTVRSVAISFAKAIAASGVAELWTSDDGVRFTKALALKTKRMGKREHGCDDQFPGITARCFRILTEADFEVMEARLSSTSGIDNTLGRTSMFKEMDNRLPPLSTKPGQLVIPKDKVIDLTKFLDKSGKLTADLPAGKWTIRRFGYSSTGYRNSPASAEGGGLEVDKMSRSAFKIHYDAYVGNVIAATKAVAPHALQYLEIDSYEVGGQNWTDGYETLFREKYGYSLIPFLPLFAGRFVDSPPISEAVLGDIRRLNSQLITDNYFGYFTELCHRDSLISYIEPYSINGPFNELDAGKHADIPMGEFWMHQRYVTETAVSSGRIYGKPIISAESFSARSDLNWKNHPGMAKTTGDKAWTLGINEFMFHRYAHQANTHVTPGMTMSEFGSHIDRTQTWWANAGAAWFTYIARGQYLLRQGVPVSDLLVFVGDGAPSEAVSRNAFSPSIPNYINYDCVNADALINRFRVEKGTLVLPEGTTYRALALHNTRTMALPTLRRLGELAKQGVVIIGKEPLRPAGYLVSDAQKAEFDALVKAVWATPTTYADFDWKTVFDSQKIAPDLVIEDRKDINYIHRKTGSEDLYFFFNPDSVARTFDCSFAIDGKLPELWNPMTGEVQRCAQFLSQSGRTILPVHVAAEASVFVVFRRPSAGIQAVLPQPDSLSQRLRFSLNANNETMVNVAKNGTYSIPFQTGKTRTITVSDLPKPMGLTNSWTVQFDKTPDFDGTVTFTTLTDWKDNPRPAVKYYSGTATYTAQFNLPTGSKKPGLRCTLDLGNVAIAAEVRLNGKALGVLWKAPFVVDVTDALLEGPNTLTVAVTNTWTNRLIGDERFPDTSGYSVNNKSMPTWYTSNGNLPPGKRTTFTTMPFYQATNALLPSGLLGPVRIVFSTQLTRK